MGTKNEEEKYGLKLNHKALIARAIKCLKGLYSEQMKDQEVDELDKFQVAFNFRSHELFAKAQYTAVKGSLTKSRRPEQVPLETDILKINALIRSSVAELTACHTLQGKDYGWLRSLIICRLTLFNARRGDEPSRMLLGQWDDALKKVWLPPTSVENVQDDAEVFLKDTSSLIYMEKEGNLCLC